MSNKKNIKWFLKEIPLLKNIGIINEPSANKLKSYYDEQLTPKSVIKILIITLSILSGLLITGGVILVVVNFNWFKLTKEFKTIIAFLLLIIPQFLCARYLYRSETSQSKREVFSVIQSILFGVSVAFIGQIYQLPKNLEGFLILWALSTLAIIYIFNSISSVALYLILVISLISEMQFSGKTGLIFYPLLSLLIPFYLIEYKKRLSYRIKVLDYFFIFSLIIGLGITLEKTLPGLWIIAYSNLFVIFYLYSITFEKEGNNLFFSPFKVAGIIGIGIFAYILTFSWPWEEIGWGYFRTENRFNDIAAFFDYSICIIFPLLTLFLTYSSIKKKKQNNYLLSIFGIITIVLYLVISSFKNIEVNELIPALIMNSFILILGGYSFYIGYKNNSLVTVNSAMFLVFLTIITRFFDQDMSALLRGFAFIAIGIIILIVNLLISKKLKGKIHEKKN